jgi:hypothetical protein
MVRAEIPAISPTNYRNSDRLKRKERKRRKEKKRKKKKTQKLGDFVNAQISRREAYLSMPITRQSINVNAWHIIAVPFDTDL